MQTDPTADAAQEAADATPDDSAAAPVASSETPQGDTPNDDTAPADPVADAVKKATSKANREAANLRKRLKDFEDAEQARKDAALSETDRIAAERDRALEDATAARATAHAAALRAEVATHAARLNIVDPDAALALMDQSTLEHGNDGTVTGVADALTALIEAKPYLVATQKPANPRLDANNGGRPGTEPSLTPQQQTAALISGRRGPSIWG